MGCVGICNELIQFTASDKHIFDGIREGVFGDDGVVILELVLSAGDFDVEAVGEEGAAEVELFVVDLKLFKYLFLHGSCKN